MSANPVHSVLTPDGASIEALERRAQDLVELDPSERVEAISELLTTLQSIEAFTVARLRVYEASRSALLAAIADIRIGEGQMTIPLSERQFALTALVIQTLSQLIDEYDCLANLVDDEIADDSDSLDVDGESDDVVDLREPYCIHRELELFDALVTVAASAYSPVPTHTWTAIHTLIERAIDLEALDFYPPEDINAPSIGDLYAVLLMVGLADPYRLSFSELRAVRAFAMDSSDRAVIGSGSGFAGSEEEQYLFAVDFDLDVPGLPWRSSRPPAGKPIDLVFDVTRVVLRARNRRLALKESNLDVDPLLSDYDSQTLSGIYKHLIVEWGKQPIRQSQRRNEGQRYDVVVGFDAVRQAPAVEITSGRDDEIVISGGVGGGSVTGVRRISLEDIGSAHGVSLDVSATGIRIRVQGALGNRIRVGEPIAFRQHNDITDTWMVGVIRWLRSSSSADVDLGVLVLGKLECSASLFDPPSEEGITKSTGVIVVSHSPYRGTRRWLVTAGAQINSPERRRLVTEQEAVMVSSLKVALQTPHMACHRCEFELAPAQDVEAEVELME